MVSRGIESRAFWPPPTRISRIESERLPLVDAPRLLGSPWAARRSRARGSCSGWSAGSRRRRDRPRRLRTPCWSWAQIRKRTSERATQAIAARTSHLTTRPTESGPAASAPAWEMERQAPARAAAVEVTVVVFAGLGSAARRSAGRGAAVRPDRRRGRRSAAPRAWVRGAGSRGPSGTSCTRVGVGGGRHPADRVTRMSAGCVIGVDLGGTKLLAGVVEPDLNVRHRVFRHAREGKGTEQLLDALVEAVEEVRDCRRARAVGGRLRDPVAGRRTHGHAPCTTVHLPLQRRRRFAM